MKALNPSIRVELFGQELNGESFGICKSDMLVTGHDPEQIAFGKPMRKSLGSKRRLIPDDARETIVHIYHEMANGDGEWTDVSKIFDTQDFGYREIRVEQPLRLNFQAAPERIERLKSDKTFLKLKVNEQSDLLEHAARTGRWIVDLPDNACPSEGLRVIG